MKNFILVLFLTVGSLLLAPQTFAVTRGTTVTVPVPAVTVQKVEYILPYPGILPDHPLYFLKILRDRILEFLIVDPVRKIEFYILQADKRLGMGVALVEKGKNDLAETTISKGEKYMNLALTLAANLKSSGRSLPADVYDRVQRAIAKHIEVLEGLLATATGSQKAALQGLLDFMKQLQVRLLQLK